jgi:hypothetical protein
MHPPLLHAQPLRKKYHICSQILFYNNSTQKTKHSTWLKFSNLFKCTKHSGRVEEKAYSNKKEVYIPISPRPFLIPPATLYPHLLLRNNNPRDTINHYAELTFIITTAHCFLHISLPLIQCQHQSPLAPTQNSCVDHLVVLSIPTHEYQKHIALHLLAF